MAAESCPQHPSYKGKRMPTSKCKKCLEIYKTSPKGQRDKILRDGWDGMSYKELAEATDWKPESVRQWGLRNGMPHKQNNAQSLPRAADVKKKRLKLSTDAQIRILTRENKILMNQANLQEELLGLARTEVEALPRVKAPAPFALDDKVTEEISVLDFSDPHIGEDIRGDELGYLNEYNFNIFCRRLQGGADAIASIHDKLSGYKLRKLYINALGDFVTGIIHNELVENADGNVFQWVFNGSLVVAQFLSELLTIYDEIVFTGVVGNHGRLQKEVRFKARYVNWDYFFYQTVALMMKDNPRITFDLPRSFFKVKEIGGRKLLLLHGDNIKSWQGIPWYGIQRAAAKLMELLSMKDSNFDDIHLAHFHNSGELAKPRGHIYINGSVAGASEYSVGALFAGVGPEQLFMGIDPRKQRVTWKYGLDFSEEGQEPRYTYGQHLVVADSVNELFGG